MGIYKLQQGQSLVMTVAAVKLDVPATNPRYGPSHQFVGRTATDPDACVFMSPASAVRQLGRIGLTLDTVVGQTIEFAKPGEYVDINRPDGSPTPVATPVPTTPTTVAQSASAKQPFSAGAPIPGLDTPPTDATEGKVREWTRLCALHKKCLEFVLTTEAPMLVEAKVGASPESVSAHTAQLFIAATQAGLHR